MLNVWFNCWSFIFGLLLPSRSAKDLIDTFDQIIVASRCVIIAWSMFRLAVQGYGWKARNHKFQSELLEWFEVSRMVKKAKSYRRVLILIGACLIVALLYWEYNNNFAIVVPFVNDKLNQTERVIEKFLGRNPTIKKLDL